MTPMGIVNPETQSSMALLRRFLSGSTKKPRGGRTCETKPPPSHTRAHIHIHAHSLRIPCIWVMNRHMVYSIPRKIFVYGNIKMLLYFQNLVFTIFADNNFSHK